MRGTLGLVTALILAAAPAWAQAVRSATLRQALQAYDQLNFPQAIVLANRSLREPLGGAERGRAYELLGSAYSAMDSALKAVDAFKQAILIDPDRQLDPTRSRPRSRAPSCSLSGRCWSCASSGWTACGSWAARLE